jgi:hypothetical protein
MGTIDPWKIAEGYQSPFWVFLALWKRPGFFLEKNAALFSWNTSRF